VGQEPPQSSTFPYPTLDWDGFTEHAESTVSSPLSFEESDTEEPTLQHDVDLMMQWVKENHADDMIQEMGCQIFDPGGLIFWAKPGYNDGGRALNVQGKRKSTSAGASSDW
jgi:hypothetical protein